MWIVALQAIADGGIVDASFDDTGILITMAFDAKLDGGYGLEGNAGNIIVYSNLVAT
jgi:hypothetical protein